MYGFNYFYIFWIINIIDKIKITWQTDFTLLQFWQLPSQVIFICRFSIIIKSCMVTGINRDFLHVFQEKLSHTFRNKLSKLLIRQFRVCSLTWGGWKRSPLLNNEGNYCLSKRHRSLRRFNQVTNHSETHLITPSPSTLRVQIASIFLAFLQICQPDSHKEVKTVKQSLIECAAKVLVN